MWIRAVPLLLERCVKLERAFRQRFTTLGTGGPARIFARRRPRRSSRKRSRTLGGAARPVVGSAPTCLFAGRWVRRSSSISRRARRGRARRELAAVAEARRTPRSPPSARRGARRLRVRERDPGHARRWRAHERRRLRSGLAAVLERRSSSTRAAHAGPTARRSAALPALGDRSGQIVARVELRLTLRDPDEIKAPSPSSSRAVRPPAENKRPSGRLQEPGARAHGRPDAGSLGLRRPPGSARRRSPRSSQFIENQVRDERRRARADGGGAPPRARALRRRVEHEWSSWARSSCRILRA